MSNLHEVVLPRRTRMFRLVMFWEARCNHKKDKEDLVGTEQVDLEYLRINIRITSVTSDAHLSNKSSAQ